MQEIGVQLFISECTVKTHVESLLDKLGAATRNVRRESGCPPRFGVDGMTNSLQNARSRFRHLLSLRKTPGCHASGSRVSDRITLFCNDCLRSHWFSAKAATTSGGNNRYGNKPVNLPELKATGRRQSNRAVSVPRETSTCNFQFPAR
jgi:hypothetical protein